MTEDRGRRQRPARLLLTTDGSELANDALVAALRLVEPSSDSLLVTVTPEVDPSLVVGTGHAGPVMTIGERDEVLAERDRAARQALDGARAVLGVGDIRAEILVGNPGEQICERAERGAFDLIVIGTSGTGGLKRALLGSVSDHVVRNAPCPVLTVGVR